MIVPTPSRQSARCCRRHRDGRLHRRTRTSPSGRDRTEGAPVERAPVFFHDKPMATPVFERGDLVPGRLMRGPAVIAEYSATTVIPAGKRFWVDAAENLVIKNR